MSSVAQWIAKHAAFRPANPALVYEGRAIGYGELARRIDATANMLALQLGIAPGDRVAYLGYNSPELLILLFACARLGAIFVPVDGGATTDVQIGVLRHSAAKVLVVEADCRQQAEGFHPQLPDCRLVACRFESSRDPSPWLSLAALIEATRGDVDHPAPDAEQPLLLLYPQPSASPLRGVLLSQRALFFNALNSLHMHALSARDVVLAVLPLCSAEGLNVQVLPALYAGATIVLHRKYEAAEALACMRVERPTLLALDSGGMAALAAQEDWARTDLRCLRAVTATTGSPGAAGEAFGEREVAVIRFYGCAETGPVGAYQRVGAAQPGPEVAGMHSELRIVDAQGNAVPVDIPGAVRVHGPTLFSGYWDDDDATAAAFDAGGFRTGDTGHLDAEGGLWLAGGEP